MTIAELIEELKKYDGAGTVGVCFWNDGWDLATRRRLCQTILACRLSRGETLNERLRRRSNNRGFALASRKASRRRNVRSSQNETCRTS